MSAHTPTPWQAEPYRGLQPENKDAQFAAEIAEMEALYGI